MADHTRGRRLGTTSVACALACSIVAGSVARAQQRISVTDAQLLATLNQAGVGDHWVITLQHFSTWRYGTNYFFADVGAPSGMQFYRDGLGLYLEYSPVFSLSRLMGRRVAGGPIADVGATLQINGGHTPDNFEIPRVFLEGADLLWTVPRFSVFETQLLARQERTYAPSWQFTWVYTVPFTVGRTPLLVQGFMDVWHRSQSGAPASTVLLAQPQILTRIAGGHGDSQLQFGVELEPSHDFPTRAVHAGWGLAYSPMLRWVF